MSVGAGRCESGTGLGIGAGFGSSSPDGLGFGLEGASALGAVLCDPCGFGWSHWAVTDGGVRLGAGVSTDAVLLFGLALVLGLGLDVADLALAGAGGNLPPAKVLGLPPVASHQKDEGVKPTKTK